MGACATGRGWAALAGRYVVRGKELHAPRNLEEFGGVLSVALLSDRTPRRKLGRSVDVLGVPGVAAESRARSAWGE